MIDKNFQGKGYDLISFNLSLKYFINKYKPNKLIISSKNQIALNLYKKHQDKSWGLVDCISFVVMKRYEVTKSLTFDRHFIQAGFQALMR